MLHRCRLMRNFAKNNRQFQYLFINKKTISMKKLYSFVALMVALFTATSASAQIQSVTELFGTWAFKADIQFNDDTYKGKILSECEVTITQSPGGIFAAEINGLCGVGNSYQQVAKLVANEDGQQTLKITNPNGGNWDAWGSLGLWMAEADGANPFGMEGYGPLYYVVSNDGKEITLPDFSFISISDWSAEKGTIIATVKNAKLTLIKKEEIEIKDLSGEYDFTATTIWDYEVIPNWPTTLKMNIVKKDDTNKSYAVTWTWEEFGTIAFDGTFDGNTLSLPYSKQVVAYDSIFLAPSNGYTLDGKIEFTLTGDNLSMSTGCTFAVPQYLDGATEPDSLSYIFWYGGGIAKLPKDKPAFDYAGTYKGKGVVAYDTGLMEVNTEGDIVIEYNDQLEAYVVKEFLGYKNPFTIDYDLMYLVPDAEDPLKATLTPACLTFVGQTDGGDYKYLATRDVNLQEYAVPVEFDKDGNMTIKDISIATTTWMGTEPEQFVIYFSVINAPKYNPSPMDWVGDHTVTTINYAFVADGANVPATGAFKVSYDENYGMFLVTDFLGYDVYAMNYGGIELKPDAADPHNATLDLTSNILDYDVNTNNATTLNDVALGTAPVEVILNDDGTVTFGDFAIAAGPWGSAPSFVIASTQESTLGIDGVKTSEVEGKTYNLQGVEVKGLQRGIVIQNVGGKFVKKYIK